MISTSRVLFFVCLMRVFVGGLNAKRSIKAGLPNDEQNLFLASIRRPFISFLLVVSPCYAGDGLAFVQCPVDHAPWRL